MAASTKVMENEQILESGSLYPNCNNLLELTVDNMVVQGNPHNMAFNRNDHMGHLSVT